MQRNYLQSYQCHHYGAMSYKILISISVTKWEPTRHFVLSWNWPRRWNRTVPSLSGPGWSWTTRSATTPSVVTGVEPSSAFKFIVYPWIILNIKACVVNFYKILSIFTMVCDREFHLLDISMMIHWWKFEIFQKFAFFSTLKPNFYIKQKWPILKSMRIF